MKQILNHKFEWSFGIQKNEQKTKSFGSGQSVLFVLTVSSIYTHFNTLKKKALGKHLEKDEIAQTEQFYLFPQCFQCNLYLKTLKSPYFSCRLQLL